MRRIIQTTAIYKVSGVGEGIGKAGGAERPVAEISAGAGDMGNPSAIPVRRRTAEEAAGYSGESEGCAGGADNAQTSGTRIKGRACVFALSFTESGRLGTLWRLRIVHKETNYFSLMRLMQKIE